jgi:hypothetical protein
LVSFASTRVSASPHSTQPTTTSNIGPVGQYDALHATRYISFATSTFASSIQISDSRESGPGIIVADSGSALNTILHPSGQPILSAAFPDGSASIDVGLPDSMILSMDVPNIPAPTSSLHQHLPLQSPSCNHNALSPTFHNSRIVSFRSPSSLITAAEERGHMHVEQMEEAQEFQFPIAEDDWEQQEEVDAVNMDSPARPVNETNGPLSDCYGYQIFLIFSFPLFAR